MGCSSSKEQNMDARWKEEFFGENNKPQTRSPENGNAATSAAPDGSKPKTNENERATVGESPTGNNSGSIPVSPSLQLKSSDAKQTANESSNPATAKPQASAPYKNNVFVNKPKKQKPSALANANNKFKVPVSSESFVPYFMDENIPAERTWITKTVPSASESGTSSDAAVDEDVLSPLPTKNGATVANKNKTRSPKSAAAPPPPPPPLVSLVGNTGNYDNAGDDLVSPLTEATPMRTLASTILDDDEFSVAPSLDLEKRSIVTVSNKSTRSQLATDSPSDEKTVVTDMTFDDIYLRGQKLGFGAFANVFLATHKPTGAVYAVKEVDRSRMMWNDKDHLKQEIDNMFKVREGPNIVQLYEFYSTFDPEEEDEEYKASKSQKKGKRKRKPNLCHLVIELMKGGELFDRIIEKRTFTEREARDSIRCVLEALKYMHERRVVHRDLKPENLLLKSKDKSKLTPVKLADFGFAKSIPSKNGCRSLCGTPGYLAPEILERFPSYDVQCDIWSVGAILFLLLGGYLPFDDENGNEARVFDRTRNAAYDFHPRCWGSVSFGAKDLISRCLTIDPRKRFTAEECLKHRWMAKSEVAGDAQLDGIVDKLQAKRQMKAAVQTLMATDRLQQLNDDFSNYLEKKRQDSTVSYMSYMTTGTRYGHAKFIADSPSGKPFEKFYWVGELLGEDDYSSVHRCVRNQTQLSYDVKHVNLTKLEQNARKTIEDEIASLKLLRGGPHIIRLLDVFEERNNPGHKYLVFEEMKGGNLLLRIDEKEVYTEREAREVCKTVFTAIDYCHRKKIAHRDIKPQNVFLYEEGDDTSVRVANFGFAKKITHEYCLQTLCGTPNYVAPEILDHRVQGYDQRCDIWSLGVFTYFLLGGYPPFEGVNENLGFEILRGEYEFHEEYWGEISDSAKQMISYMLLVDPRQRISAAEALSCKWMETEEERLVLRDLSLAQNSIRETLQPTQKVKGAASAILAPNKFLSIAGMFKSDDSSISVATPVRIPTLCDIKDAAFRDLFAWGSLIGSGSFSVVHEVMMKKTNQLFAAKRIERNDLHPSDAVALHDEIAALQEVSGCEHIVKLYNVFDEPDYTFLVLECMKGGDLIDRIIEKHNYTEFDAKEVTRKLLMGLAYCHKRKIANRNLKPENLLLKANSDTDVKISDFGYAKKVTFPNCLRTQCGTEGYVAPEILEHRPAYDVCCDMWSLGVIMYIMLGGYRPFRGEGEEVMKQIRYGEYKFHKRYWSDVSDDAKDLIASMLTVDPVKRITAEMALSASWIQADRGSLGGVELSKNLEDLKTGRNAKRTMKAAASVVIATNKLQSIGGFRAYQDF